MSLADRLAEIIANPFDDTPRLAYATECDAAEPERAEFIRLQVARAERERSGGSAPTPSGLSELQVAVNLRRANRRERALLEHYGAHWAAPLGPLGDGLVYDRGFVSQASMAASDFLAHGRALRSAAPILCLRLTGCRPVAEAVFTSADLAGLPALDLTHNDLSTPELLHLTSSPHVQDLWWLELRGNHLDFPGCKLLASSRFLPRLGYVGLEGNPCNPMETVGLEGFTILDGSLPAEGERMEALYGRVSWIHFPGDSVEDWPPNPLAPQP